MRAYEQPEVMGGVDVRSIHHPKTYMSLFNLWFRAVKQSHTNNTTLAIPAASDFSRDS